MKIFIHTKNKYKTKTDAELVLGYQKTLNNDYLGALFDRYGHLVYGVALKYLQNKDLSKDFVIRVFEKVMHDLKRMQVHHFKSWLYQVSKNQCLMDLRKAPLETALSSSIEQLEYAQINHSQELHFSVRELRYGQLERAVQLLKPDQKKCIELFYIQNNSYQQIAAATGYTLNEIKSALQNGKRNLRNILEKDTVFKETLNA